MRTANGLPDRILRRLVFDPETNCLLWTGQRVKGYGVTVLNGKHRYVHRLMYEWLAGPVPEGRELDHLCRIKHCANPAHLEAVTHAENIRRGKTGAHNAAKTHCPRGHPYDRANTMVCAGARSCRQCYRDAKRRRREAERAARSA